MVARPSGPELPTGSIEIQPPPDKAEPPAMGNVLIMVLPMMGSMGVMVFMAVSQRNNMRMLLMGGVMLVAMVSIVGFNLYRQISTHTRAVRTLRGEYLGHLAQTRTTVRQAARQQRDFLTWRLPDPEALVLLAEEGSRLWEREIGDEAVLGVRLGTSSQPLSAELVEPELPPTANPDVVCHSAMSRFLATHRTVDSAPFAIPLGQFSHIEVAGDSGAAQDQVRAMLLHLAVFIPPTALRIAVLCSPEAAQRWEWIKWLPHARSTEAFDALGGARMVATNAAELFSLLGDELTDRPPFRPRTGATGWPHLLVVLDGESLPEQTQLGSPQGAEGVTVMPLVRGEGALTSPSALRLVVDSDSEDSSGASGAMTVQLVDRAAQAVPDALSIPQAEAVARRLTHWTSGTVTRSATPIGQPDPRRSADLMELLGVGDVRDFDPRVAWRRREGRERLRIPFGITPEGMPAVLDFKEAAEEGMGPHGLLIGATGSGKSEVLRTMVLALALTHAPDQLNFVLVDFKGGATFAGMAQMPHVSAMISNLESELSLVDRMGEALHGELVRRQELLRDAGNYANVTDYEADRLAGRHSGPPLPALMIILDEFSELLSAKQEFIEVFVMIGRLGRSLGVHLLLASQRLESGRLRGLDSHLSYRIGLRTFSSSESREVLGVNDAYELPMFPGVGYLKTGSEQMLRFRSSYVAAPPPPRQAVTLAGAGSASAPIRLLPFSVAPVLSLEEPPEEPQETEVTLAGDQRWEGMTEIDIAVARMAGHGTPAHQVWLPPLDVPETMDTIMPDLAEHRGLGLVSRAWRARGPLRIPLAVVDLPLEQKRELLELDLSGANGHLAIVGGPLTGKSTALRSVVMSLSLTHTPQEVQFYVLDMGGGTFSAFAGAAHVAGVAAGDDRESVNRVVAEIEGLIRERERAFRRHRLDSMGAYRAARARGEVDDGYGDIFLVIDGWGALRADYENIEARVHNLMPRALTYGVHLVIASQRWMEMRAPVRDLIGSRLELRLGEASDTVLSRKAAQAVPTGRPGRGIDARGHHLLIALPRADGDHGTQTLADGVRSTLERISRAVPAGPAPRLRLLPERVTVQEVLQAGTEVVSLDGVQPAGPDGRSAVSAQSGPILGVEEMRLGALTFNPRTQSHLFGFGEAKSGKTNMLRSLASEIVRCYSPQEARIFLLDPRRTLMGEVPQEYLTGYTSSREEMHQLMNGLTEYLRTRLPSGDVTPEQLRARSWWQGADAWVLVDDYDLVATASGNPVSALLPLLSQAQDVGLHLVVVRRSGGAGRAMYEPVIQALSELGTTGFLLSGSPDEGPIIGRHRMERAVPGRARVISRELGAVATQLLWSPPTV